MATIYLAGGCFWGIQGYFDRLKGVQDSQVGYANSYIANPTYEMVCSGTSGAVEAL
ncbi:peptide-methionine (S)-S-oxide reductase, partial [Helicobacter typhlonius]